MISKRAQQITASSIRKAFVLAQSLDNPINMSIGQPDFPVPNEIKEAAQEAIKLDYNSYTLTQGIEPLRKAVAKKLRDKNQITQANENSVLITSAVSGALTLALPACIDPGDEVIIFDPCFAGYRQLILLNSGVPVTVALSEDFSLNEEALEKAINAKTKAVIFNTPGNPTGHVVSKEEIETLAKVARKHDLIVLSDEIYEDFIYNSEKPHISIGSIYEKTVTMSGFSKSHGMTGWRIGYAQGPAEIVEKMMEIQQYTFVCAPAPLQHAALVALKTDIKSHINRYQKNRDYLIDSLGNTYEFNPPEGAFYFFVKYPYEGEKFLNNCIKNNLLVVPGDAFSLKNTHFRLSFATNRETIERGVVALHKINPQKSP
ncbi:MAG TPA: aminotransferase class I/II-fold pyridoxal phosphate-dependent enzyme [Candidatus Moranbacteria bacterium]|nr:aminotransferase class I/II-fold pyridoxal phosphate-dependent enzyme [Candidatus Moranbacteria bacterium]